jgi:hypothetical protein
MRREQFKLKLAALKTHAMSVPPGEAVLAIREAAVELNATDVSSNELLSTVIQGLEKIAKVLSSSLSLRRAALGSNELDLDGDNWLRSIAMNTIHHLQNVLNGGIDAVDNFEETMKRVHDTHPLFRDKEAMRLESRARRGRSRSRSPPSRSQQGRRFREDSPPRRYRDDSPPRRNRRSASAPRRRETRGRSRARSPIYRDERAGTTESPGVRERDRKRSASTPRKRRDSIDEGTDEILRAAINADKQRHPDVYPRDGKGCTNCIFLGRGSSAAATHQSYQCYSKREAMQKAAAEMKSAAKRGATPRK